VTAASRLSDSEIKAAKETYARDGYFILRSVVSEELLAGLHASLKEEFDRVTTSGELFSGGGLVSGHLNCFPGAGARAVYETLQERGVIDLIRELHPNANRMPNVGCNFNLPGSHTQHWHLDRPFNKEFMIANITVVDTTPQNGATDVIPGSHKRFYKYTQFVLERIARNNKRVVTNRGDVVVRSSNVWHRGMTNLTSTPRPMLAFTWEDGGSNLPDPFNFNDGKIRFLPNWFKLTPMGRLRERLFVKVPATYSALRFARSLVDSEY
jgi:ectoine hydroxylase-related dioxygenase (phytanoyl-CoA dioxygenase family)